MSPTATDFPVSTLLIPRTQPFHAGNATPLSNRSALISLRPAAALALLALLSWLLPASAAARSAGMDIAADGASIHYQGNPATRKRGGRWGHYTPQYRLLYAQATAPRNLLFSADAELHRFTKTFADTYQLGGKTYLLAANYHDQRAVAIGVGALLQAPARKQWPIATQLELFGAPQVTTALDGNYIWGIELRGSYPLPDNQALNVGFRKIKMGVDEVSATSFQNSLYLGLMSRF